MPNTPVPAAAIGLPIPEHVRSAIAAEIDRLIYLLDLVDGDTDLEDTGDREPDSDDEHGGDEEPSLGSLDKAGDQRRWSECEAFNACQDLELDLSDFEGVAWSNPLAAQLDARGNLIMERVRDRQVRR